MSDSVLKYKIKVNSVSETSLFKSDGIVNLPLVILSI